MNAELKAKIRFTRSVEVDSGGHWLWMGCVSHGYGTFYLNGRSCRAHRVVYEWAVGPIPYGLQIDHLCRVTYCVNPDHLEAVTNRENSHRARKAGSTRPRPFKKSSKYVGVFRVTDGRRSWFAAIKIDEVHHKLGFYPTESEAAAAYAAVRDGLMTVEEAIRQNHLAKPKCPHGIQLKRMDARYAQRKCLPCSQLLHRQWNESARLKKERAIIEALQGESKEQG